MSPLPDLSGIIAWSRRAEWRDALAERLEQHAGAACAAAGIDMSEIETLLGDYGASTVWGAAFEDLLTQDLPDGRNLAEEYLRRRGWKESATTRDYITGLRHSRVSLYEVTAVQPAEWVRLRDLIGGGEPVQVMERSGSRGLRLWDHIATRVVPMRQHSVVSGVLMVFDHRESEALRAALRRIRSRASREAVSLARSLKSELDRRTLLRTFAPEQLLQQAAFLFTNHWLATRLRAAQGLDRPRLVNAEGDPIAVTRVHFPLRPGVATERLRGVLAGLAELREEDPGFWNWLAPADRKPQRVPRRRGTQALISTMEDGSLVLGTLCLAGERLTLEVNSVARARRGLAMLAEALEGLVGPPLIEHGEAAGTPAGQGPPPAPSALSPEEQRALVLQTLDDHYRRVLDEPIPALGGRSPRQAAKTAKGREKVAAWLKTLENHAAYRPPDDPIGSYDFAWMWRELGAESLRR